jgi:hypothetical protein
MERSKPVSTDDQARRLKHMGERTPAHIMSAINLLAHHCKEHGYPTLTIGASGGAVFHADNILDLYAEALNALAAAESIGAPSSGLAETARRALEWWAAYIGPQAPGYAAERAAAREEPPQ